MNIIETQKQEFMEVVSKERLESYRIMPNDDFTILLKRYIFNIQISEAFYPILSTLEIALRNRMHNAISLLIQPDWLLSELYTQKILSYNEREILFNAEKKLKFKNKDNGKSITESALIAELSFGFWINLCKKSYKNSLWDKPNFFSSVFTDFDSYFHINDLDKTKTMFPKLKTILQLRNRIFHHEIVINHKLGIENCYDLVEKVLFSLSEAYSNLVIDASRFKSIIKQNP